MPAPISQPMAFPRDGRRLVIYVVWDRRGEVDDFIPVALEGLRPHADRILVVVNGSLSDAGREKLTPVSDEILVRENTGFDIWAHKDALAHVGPSIDHFDEVVLTNDTWFGPIRPYDVVFERMDAEDVHFWGMTDHAREEPNPFTGEGVLEYHLQSFWICVRREMFQSQAWADYWRDLPEMPGYFDAVLQHEAVFTHHFVTRGFTVQAAFPSVNYPTDHPALFNPELLLRDGCPLLKRRPLFHYPPFLDRHAVFGRAILSEVADYGFPVEVITQNLARHVAPRTLNADLGMLEVLGDGPTREPTEHPFRVVVIAHAENPEGVDDLLLRASFLSGAFDVVITTPAGGHETAVREAAAEASVALPGSLDVRVVPHREGADMSAFFVGCRDVLTAGRYDIVVKLHTGYRGSPSANARRYFRRFQWENLLSSPAYASGVLALFERERGLGAVFPPTIHIGFATLGGAWWGARDRAERTAKDLGIHVPLDGASPLAPIGGMWVARVDALRLLIDRPWSWSDYSDGGYEGLGALGAVQERIVAHAAGELGFHVRTILNAEHASLSHLALEYKLDQLASTTPGYPIEQIQFLHRLGFVRGGTALDFLRMHVRMNHPTALHRVAPLYRFVGRMRRGTAAVARRVTRRSAA